MLITDFDGLEFDLHFAEVMNSLILVKGQNHIGAGLIWLQLQVLEQTTIQLLSAKFVQKAACLCK